MRDKIRMNACRGYVSFKQVTPWPWHVEIIVGVSVVREREGQRETQTDRQMRQTVKEKIRDRQTNRQTD